MYKAFDPNSIDKLRLLELLEKHDYLRKSVCRELGISAILLLRTARHYGIPMPLAKKISCKTPAEYWEAMDACNNRPTYAARYLGVSDSTFQKYMKRYGRVKG